MSSEAMGWAFRQDIKPSSVKFTLVALCECANYRSGKIFPSIAHLCEITNLDRKTILKNIAILIEIGAIQETGERVGSTGQIKVYQAALGSTLETVPKTEQSQKRNSSVFPSNSPKIGTGNSPKNGTRNLQEEPSREPSRYKGKPDGVSDEVWRDFVELRERKKAPITATAMKGFAREAAKAGWTLEAALTETILHGWRGFNADWVKGKSNGQRANGNGPTNGLFDAALDELNQRGQPYG